jgi:hypothetical protein
MRSNARARASTLVVMTSTADCVSGHAQQRQNESDDHEDDAYGPQDRNFGDEPNDEQDDAQDNHSVPPTFQDVNRVTGLRSVAVDLHQLPAPREANPDNTEL